MLELQKGFLMPLLSLLSHARRCSLWCSLLLQDARAFVATSELPCGLPGCLSYQEVLVPLSLRIRQETGHRGWFCGGRHLCTCQPSDPGT